MDEIKYGLLGERLGYSYSKIIYESLGFDYKLIEVGLSELKTLLKEKKFKGLNVTIPYKEKVIPYLDEVRGVAKEIGVVNTIVNENGKLVGYNTDYDGFNYLLSEFGEASELKKHDFLVLGTGATNKTVIKVLKDNGINNIKVASRKDGYDYKTDDLKGKFDYVINTTPLGTYPNIDSKVSVIANNIIDVVYNPYRSRLALDNIFIASGLDMLIVQALKSMELFSLKVNKGVDEVKRDLLFNIGNIVLIGMPGTGKTTIGRLLSEELKMNFVDTDSIIEKDEPISDIINRDEEEFRKIEADVIKKVSMLHHHVIATGGGIVENEENIKHLASNGFIIYIERELNEIYKTFTPHPLIKSKADLENVYNRRRDLYLKYSDIIVSGFDKESVLRNILQKIKK